MDTVKLFAEIDRLTDAYIKVWEDISRIESPTAYKPGVDAVCDYFIAIAKKFGWDVEVLRQSKAGNAACITMNPNAKKAPICLSGHMDTVHPVGSYGEDPVRLDEKNIYGPGVCDCKGGIVAGFLAMEALHNCGFTDRPVKMILQSDEEVGSKLSERATINYMCEKAQGAAAFLNLEPSGGGTATIARKGIATFVFKISGKEAHAAACATSGANAIIEAAHKMIEIDKHKDADGITCNCGTISGGSVPNTVPGKCEFCVNVRYVTTEQLEEVRAFMKEIADTVYVKGTTCELNELTGRIPMELTERNTDLLDKLNAIFAESGLDELKGVKSLGGADSAEITASGVPCLCSLGVRGGGYHSPSEYGILASLAESAKYAAAAIVGL